MPTAIIDALRVLTIGSLPSLLADTCAKYARAVISTVHLANFVFTRIRARLALG